MIATAFAFILSLSATTGADTAAHFDDPVEVDPIVVVGTREPEKLSRVVNSAVTLSLSSVRTSTQENILSILDTRHASITVNKVGMAGYGLGSQSSGKMLIRGLGFSPNRGVLVMIDGRPDMAGLFGHPLPDTYRRAGASSAGLIKGAASTVYGSNAVGGVLDIESFHRPDLPRYTNVELDIGSHETYNSLVQHSRHLGPFNVAGWYEYIESDNHRDNMWYFNRSGGVRVDLDETHGFNWFLAGKVSSFDFANPGPEQLPSLMTGDIIRTGWTLGADRRAEQYDLAIRAYSSYGEHAFSDGFNSVDRNNGIDLSVRVRPQGFETIRVSTGVSLNYLGGSATDGTPFVQSGNFSEYELAGRLQVELQATDAIHLTGGGRLIDHDRYGHHVTGQIGAVIHPGDIGSIKLSAASAYRNPTVSESQLFLISNADSLEPEDGSFYEIGYFKAFGELLSIEGAYFWRDGDNLIATLRNPSPPPIKLFQNAGAYEHSGYEATLRVNAGPVTVMPSFIHLNMHSFNSSVPEDKLTVHAAYTRDRFRLEANAVAAWKTASDSVVVTPQGQMSVPVTLDDYLVLSATGTVDIYAGLAVRLRVENLLDDNYETIWGYPMPGTTVKAGLSYRLH